MEYPLPLHSQCGCPLADRPVPVVDAKLEERLLDILGGAEVVHRLCAHRARRHSPRLLGGARFRRRNSNLASKCGRLAVIHRNNFEHFILPKIHMYLDWNGISPRQNIHDHPCNRSGKSAALANASPEVASAIDRSSPAFSTLVSRSSRGSSPLFGSMRQSILGDQGCNRSGEHEGSRSSGDRVL